MDLLVCGRFWPRSNVRYNCLKIVVSPVRVRVSPFPKGLQTLSFARGVAVRRIGSGAPAGLFGPFKPRTADAGSLRRTSGVIVMWGRPCTIQLTSGDASTTSSRASIAATTTYRLRGSTDTRLALGHAAHFPSTIAMHAQACSSTRDGHSGGSPSDRRSERDRCTSQARHR